VPLSGQTPPMRACMWSPMDPEELCRPKCPSPKSWHTDKGPRATVQRRPSGWDPESSMGMEEPMVKQVVHVLLKVKASQATWVPKNVPIVMSDTPRDVPVTGWKAGRPCFPWMKGGQALSTCAACYRLKISCKTSVGTTTGKKEAEERES